MFLKGFEMEMKAKTDHLEEREKNAFKYQKSSKQLTCHVQSGAVKLQYCTLYSDEIVMLSSFALEVNQFLSEKLQILVLKIRLAAREYSQQHKMPANFASTFQQIFKHNFESLNTLASRIFFVFL